MPRTILAVAPRYRPASIEAVSGHWTVYQDDLRAAAQDLGIEYVILGPRDAPGSSGMRSCLSHESPRATISSVAEHLANEPVESGALVLLYEGSLELLELLISIARRFPAHTFVINLFHHDRFLDVPRTGREPLRKTSTFARYRAGEPRMLQQHWSAAQFPVNLVVMAETPRRAFLAQSLGIPVAGTWALHSQLWDVARSPQRVGENVPTDLAILIPISAWWLSDVVVDEVVRVVRMVRRWSNHATRWTVSGSLRPRPDAARRLRKLERAGIDIRSGELDQASYASIFVEHDACWFPVRGVYNTQSSGKALDALVLGIPAVGPFGSFAADEAARWIPGGLGYGTAREAAELFLHLPLVLDEVRASLGRNATQIRERYSPHASLAQVLDRVDRAGAATA